MAKVQPSVLTLDRLMNCYDMCTMACLDRIVGRESDTTACDEHTTFGFLERYRSTFRDVTVSRVYLFCSGRFRIGDADAVGHLQQDDLVFIPLIVPENNKRHLLPTSVTDRIYVTVYGQLLYTLWDHLRSYKNAVDVASATVISFQDVPELAYIKNTFAGRCSELRDGTNSPLFDPLNESTVDLLRRKYEQRA